MNKHVDTAPAPLRQEHHAAGILRLVIVNPPANSLSEAVLTGLADALARAADNKEVRVIVIAASGKLFSAGHDMKEMTANRENGDGGRNYFTSVIELCATVMQTIVNHPKPVIAEVDGAAFAAGLQLAASCDLVVASEQATFCMPGVHIGLFCSTPMVALSRAVGHKQAMDMLLTGRPISAAEALQFGLVNRLVAKSELAATVAELASAIASKSAMTMKVGKQAFYAQAEMPLADAYGYASQVMVDNMLCRDAEEGIAAFIEKRDPEWQDQ